MHWQGKDDDFVAEQAGLLSVLVGGMSDILLTIVEHAIVLLVPTYCHFLGIPST